MKKFFNIINPVILGCGYMGLILAFFYPGVPSWVGGIPIYIYWFSDKYYKILYFFLYLMSCLTFQKLLIFSIKLTASFNLMSLSILSILSTILVILVYPLMQAWFYNIFRYMSYTRELTK